MTTAMTAASIPPSEDRPDLSACTARLVGAWSALLDHGPAAAVIADTLLIVEGHLIEAQDAKKAMADALLDDAGTLLEVVRLALVASGDAYAEPLIALDAVRADLAAARA